MPNPSVSSIQQQFADAMALHQLGRWAEAEAGYRTILKSYRRHFDAAHFLGLVFLQRGEAEAAESQIGHALKFASGEVENRNLAEAHNNRGLALTQLKRFEEALACFDSAIAARPDHIEAFANRGGALHELGVPEESLAASDPGGYFPAALHHRWPLSEGCPGLRPRRCLAGVISPHHLRWSRCTRKNTDWTSGLITT